MKAAIYKSYGPPEVVKISRTDMPVPKPDEVLIKVHATTVNRTDCGFRSAQYFISRLFSGLWRPRNKILGNEFAGVVESIGVEISQYREGDNVFGYNDLKFGAHAEYMAMPETGAMATMPAGLSYKEATPITEGAHYALCNLRAARVNRGQQVLINGATGGIGSAAVQLAKYFGAEVTAVCNTQNLSLVKSLGADAVVDYLKEDFTQTTAQFDVVFDAVGKSSFGKCKPLLKSQGIYISTELGKYSGNIFRALTTRFGTGKRVLFPIPSSRKEDVEFLKELVEAGTFKPVIDRQYALDEIVEAYRYVEAGEKTGNVVIVIE